MKIERRISETEPKNELELLIQQLIEYENLYEDEDYDQNSYAERVSLQGKLSEKIVTSRSLDLAKAITSYFKNHDRNLKSKKGKLPHIYEAIQSTVEIQSVAEEISTSFSNIAIATLQFGSATWGAFYSTHNDSDVDLEIVVNSFDKEIAKNQLFDENRDDILDVLRISEDHDLDMLLYKATHRGREIMLHFIPRASFERFMGTQLVPPSTQRMGFREMRSYFNGVTDYSDRCSFNDNRRSWLATHHDLHNGWHIVEKPVYQIEDGILYNGIWPEWHLTPLVVLGGDFEWSLAMRDGLYEEFIKRMIEERRYNSQNSKFSNILERKSRMPNWLIEKMDKSAEEKIQEILSSEKWLS